MNTINTWQTTVTINDPARKQFWESTIGTSTLPIKSIMPIFCNLPGKTRAYVYMLDVQAISDEMRSKIAAGIGQQFGVDPATVESEMIMTGAPILAEDCIVQSSDPATLMSMLI
jgi:hypothetical protein